MKSFNLPKLLLATLTLLVSIPHPGMAAPNICEEWGNHRYMNFRDDGPGKRKRGYVCVVIRDNPNLKGVLTLKHLNNRGNWDILVGTHFDPASKKMYGGINYQNNRGSVDELVWLPGTSNREYVVVAFPNSNTPSNACLVFHRINNSEIIGQALGEALIKAGIRYVSGGNNLSQKDKAQSDRIIGAGLSVLSRNNLADVGYDVVLNEISIQLSNFFGTDSWMLDFGVSYFGNYVKESGKFLFDKNMRCT
ncbi:hypothetical protein [Brasilonema sp. UFV-L1]|uniref:hypothetical protein n=1 Tax=Brasilonema sp. UFV-L1 TaxID=2234130 RepID=UPI001B7D10F6|nr:hypothetical protein [Brasilonema sp. UFV-L1]